ncbi:MAG: T9SS type A sorting domain-containing protein [Ignavibacteriae bacterium]|nr:T9SS type A sorting domain-containing protein [Ignavibacteriota bacterium]
MNTTNNKYWLMILVSLFYSLNAFSQTTIDQKLAIHANSGFIGGQFSIEYRIKGSTLNNAKTLGSLNTDIIYDTTLIRFVNASNWCNEISEADGYEKFVNNNNESDNYNSLRIMITGLNVNSDSMQTHNGFNLKNSYTTIVRLNFIIINNTNNASLTIKSSTNQIGLFTNPGNNPNTFEIGDQILTPPIVIENEPLPVLITEFSSFTNSDNVTLKWVTSFEQNNSGFKIERKQINSNWNEIGFIKGKGNSNTQTQYSFEDKKLTSGKYNYRIKQIDNNGNYKYFNLKSTIEIGVPTKFNLSQNYPNPFNPTTKINYELARDSKVNITVFDILGREIIKLVNQEQKAGYYTIAADSKNLASGTYFYRLIANANGNDYIITKKMNVIK